MECGITRHRTVTYTPKQNGLAERMNRTLLKMVRCILVSTRLAKRYWVEALHTAYYCINKFHSTHWVLNHLKKCGWVSLHPLSLLKCASDDYFRVLGYVIYMHKRMGKLELIAVKCFFLGSTDVVKGYKL